MNNTRQHEAAAILKGKLVNLSHSEEVIQAFLGELEFSEGRLTHANYGMLAEHINKKGLRDVFAALGVSKEQFDDNSHLVCRDGHCVLGNGYCDDSDCI